MHNWAKWPCTIMMAGISNKKWERVATPLPTPHLTESSPTPSPTSPICVVGMGDADDRCVSSPNFPENCGTSFFCSITFEVDATLLVVGFGIELSYDVSLLEDWVVDVRENPAAQPGWIHQAPDRWTCEARYGCSLCSSSSARGAHERYVVAAKVCAGFFESREPFEVSADGQRSRVDPHGTNL